MTTCKVHTINRPLKEKIIKYIQNNQPQVYWHYNDMLSEKQIISMLERKDTIIELEDDIFDNNIDYIWELEYDLFDNIIENFNLDMEHEDLRNEFIDYIHVDLNLKQLFNNTPDLTVLINVHSNYDCAISTSKMEPYDYLYEVYQRVKGALRKKDYMYEADHIYGGSLFCFIFKTDIKTLLKLKENFENSITIPKGTQYGFFSSFVGSGSIIEARTTKTITLPKVEPNQTEYDCIDIIADCEQSYSICDVYGGDSFIDNQKIIVK